MKKFVLLFTIALFIMAMPVIASEAPEKVILHNALDYEVDGSPTGKYVKAKKDTKLYLTADDKSEVIAVLHAEQPAMVKGYELHTSPGQNAYLLTKKIKTFTKDNPHIKTNQPMPHDEIYFLTYRGEGYFQAWWKGNIIWVQPTYTVSVVGSQLWLCLMHPDTGLEGWAPVDKQDWYINQTDIFFADEKSFMWAN